MNDSNQRTLVKFYQVNNASLSSLPIEAGHLIFVTDTKRLYLDRTNQDRIEIASYNLTQSAVDGHILTFTNANGTQTTITIPDNNTTYTAGDGIVLNDTVFSNGGVRTIATGTDNGTIAVNTNGTTADVAVKGLKALAYKDSLTAVEIGAIASSLKGAANGVAELDNDGKVPSSQLPSYVDDVLEYNSLSDFPVTGESGKVYIALDTNITYRWSGSTYVKIASDLALGETSSTAYRGDRGVAAYTHAVINKGSQFASGLYKITTNEEGHVTAASNVVKSDITNLGIPSSDTTYAALTETEIDNITNVIITNLDEVSF